MHILAKRTTVEVMDLEKFYLTGAFNTMLSMIIKKSKCFLGENMIDYYDDGWLLSLI